MSNIKYVKVYMAYLLNDQNFEKYFVLLTLPNLVYFCINHNNGNKRLIHSEWLKSGYICIYCSESDQKYLNRMTEKLWD